MNSECYREVFAREFDSLDKIDVLCKDSDANSEFKCGGIGGVNTSSEL